MASARSATFHEHAQSRLRAGTAAYGDVSYGRPAGELLWEVMEEAADIATWSHITRVAIERADLAPETRQDVETALRAATGLAESAWNAIRKARESIT